MSSETSDGVRGVSSGSSLSPWTGFFLSLSWPLVVVVRGRAFCGSVCGSVSDCAAPVTVKAISITVASAIRLLFFILISKPPELSLGSTPEKNYFNRLKQDDRIKH
jgi:hypothetical protein